MSRLRGWIFASILSSCAVLACSDALHAQTQPGTSTTGLGFVPQIGTGGGQGQFGVTAVPMAFGSAGQGAGRGGNERNRHGSAWPGLCLRTRGSDDSWAGGLVHAVDPAADAGTGKWPDQRSRGGIPSDPRAARTTGTTSRGLIRSRPTPGTPMSPADRPLGTSTGRPGGVQGPAHTINGRCVTSRRQDNNENLLAFDLSSGGLCRF